MSTDENTTIASCTAQRMGLEILNTGPHTLPMLARMFADMHPDVLASCWLALFVDAMGETGAPMAEIARCLNPVVVKLNHRPAKAMRRTSPKKGKYHNGITPGINTAVGDSGENLRDLRSDGETRIPATVFGSVRNRAKMRQSDLVRVPSVRPGKV